MPVWLFLFGAEMARLLPGYPPEFDLGDFGLFEHGGSPGFGVVERDLVWRGKFGSISNCGGLTETKSVSVIYT